MDDLLIRGGHVLDGSGGPGRDADVVVRAGRIAAIEPRASGPAHRVIDARGLVVAPGFIDIHTHSDFTLPLNPRAESKIRQGVTLEVVGNCGFSVAPALPGRAAMLREYLASSATWLPFQDTTFADYAIPGATEIPPVVLANTVTESPLNPLGAKGIGESATVGSTPAVQNAVIDALSHLGVRHLDMPLKPSRVLRAVHAAAAGTLPDPWREPPGAFDGLPVRGADAGQDSATV